MTVKELKEKAKALGVQKVSTLRAKAALVWAIQKAEGNDECFTKIPDCQVMECCFRADCIPAKKG